MKLNDADLVELALQFYPLVIVGDVSYGRRGALGQRLVITVEHPSGEYAYEAFAERLRKIVCAGRTFVISDRLDLFYAALYLGERKDLGERKVETPRIELCYFEARESRTRSRSW